MKYVITLFMIIINMIAYCKQVTEIVDVYKLKMTLAVPVVKNNMQSLGSREFDKQKFEGILYIKYKSDYEPEFEIVDLVNKNYKISGKNVTYKCYDSGNFVLSYIGNNKTNKFKKPTIAISTLCDPSYNIGDLVKDNTLNLEISGKGKSKNYSRYNARIPYYFSGKVAGRIGCACYSYGHKSPTRLGGSNGPILDYVVDIAALEGTWKSIFKYRFSRKVEIEDEE